MKYIIEIEDKPINVERQLYMAKGFYNLVFSKDDLCRLTEYKPAETEDISKQLQSIADSLSGIKYILNNSNRSIL